MSSQIFGNLLAAQILGHLSQTEYMSLMSFFAFFFSLFFLFLKKPVIRYSKSEEKVGDEEFY